MTYSFESPKVFDKLRIPADSKLRETVEIMNPLGEDYSVMRTTSLNGMLTSLATNYNRRNKNVRLVRTWKYLSAKTASDHRTSGGKNAVYIWECMEKGISSA